jgi:hypothetical protein
MSKRSKASEYSDIAGLTDGGTSLLERQQLRPGGHLETFRAQADRAG